MESRLLCNSLSGLGPGGDLGSSLQTFCSKPADLVRSVQAEQMGLSVWTQNTFFVGLDLSRTQVWWPSAWESRLSHHWSVCILTGIYLDSDRLQVWTLLLGTHRHLPQALARGQYSLTPLADEGEERFYSEDILNSIHPLNSALSFHAYMGKEFSSLSMQKCSSIPILSSSPSSQEFCFHPASVLT